MEQRRRQVLKGVGVGVAVSILGTPSTATDTARVFVHPATGLVSDVLDVVDTLGGETIREYDNFDFILAEIPSNRLDELRSDLRVAFIERDDDVGIPDNWTPSLPPILDPGDADDCSTHPEQSPSWGWERIGADAVESDGSGVDVGILDTGIQTDHCSLSVAGGRNVTDSVRSDDYEDRHGHGTHVAGVVGALDNDIGVVGVAPAVDLYAVKVLDDDGSGTYSALVAGIDWCLSNDVELISMSLGGDSDSSTVDQAIEEAHAAGHLLLSAAGNDGNHGDGSCAEETMTYPATHGDVVAVTAMDEDETLASYSSVGSAIDLLAPGTEIDSTYVDNEYARASGTSVACPFVTGVAALVWQTRDETGPGPNDPVRAILTDTAETVLDTCEEGNGLVDAPAALGDDRASDGDDGTSDDDDGAQDDSDGSPGDADDADSIHDSGRTGGWLGSVFDRLAAGIRGFFDWLLGLFR